MDSLGNRALTSQLAEDLSWLEDHSRKHGAGETPDMARLADRDLLTCELRTAAALVRNCIGPYLDNQEPTPLHIVVLGGAGAGKSTVANLLSGAQAAETNPQAGFTRHPIVYTTTTGALNWTGHVGFLGPLQRAPQESPASFDADVYQVRRVPIDATSHELLRDFVVWDCPDMTTWAAAGVSSNGAGTRTAGYISRLLEVTALADVVVFVASDERYNDEMPTQFLHLILRSGKPVIVCLTKMRAEEVEPLIEHFKHAVVRNLPPGVVEVLGIPFLSAEELRDPARSASQHRIPVLNQVGVLGMNPPEARRRVIAGAVSYLRGSQERLLSVARHDVAALETWRANVQSGQVEFNQRYQREYLNSEKYRGFDDALLRLLGLLELPGVGKIISGVLWVLRTPFRLLKAVIGKVRRHDSIALPELPVLEDSLVAWIDMLRKEAARQANSHAVWAHIAQGFATGGLSELIKERFQQGFRGFQIALADECDRAARAIYERLEQNPALLNSLRGMKLALDGAAVGGALALGGVGLHDIILVPLAASLTHQLAELLGKQYVDSQRELVRQRQMALMSQYISSPLTDWLAQWPATGGSTFERLQLALRRIPSALQQLQKAVEVRPAPMRVPA